MPAVRRATTSRLRATHAVVGCWLGGCAIAAGSLAFATSALAQSTVQADLALAAVSRDDCGAAIDALNVGMDAAEPRAFFIAGQLFESGVCLKTDPAKAAQTYERAALLGDLDAARSRAVLSALGSGVAQSYPDAGRWYGVMRQERHGVEAPSAASYAEPGAVARAYVDAVHDVALRALVYPRDAAVARITGDVVVRFDPRGGAAAVVSSTDNAGASTNHLGPGKRTFERAILAGYDEARRTLPKPEQPASGDFATDRRVRFDRIANASSGPIGRDLNR